MKLRFILRAVLLSLIISAGIVLVAVSVLGGCAALPKGSTSDQVRASVFMPACFMFCFAGASANDASTDIQPKGEEHHEGSDREYGNK